MMNQFEEGKKINYHLCHTTFMTLEAFFLIPKFYTQLSYARMDENGIELKCQPPHKTAETDCE